MDAFLYPTILNKKNRIIIIKNWKKYFIFDIFLTNKQHCKKKTIIPGIELNISDIPTILNDREFLGIYQSCFNRGAIQVKKINELFVLKIMLEDAAFF